MNRDYVLTMTQNCNSNNSRSKTSIIKNKTTEYEFKQIYNNN